MGMPVKPFIALDIDGVLNALSLGPLPEGWGDLMVCRSEGRERPRLFRLRLAPSHGQKLMQLAADTDADLVWCSRWQEMANDLMSPLLGLPELPWVPMAPDDLKIAALHRWADGRLFTWLDDEPYQAGSALDYPGTWCLVEVSPELGLQDHHLDAVRSWLNANREPASGELQDSDGRRDAVPGD